MSTREENPGAGDDSKRDGINPGNACDYCRRLKMKCIGKETPPCQRCKGSKKPCTFGMEIKPKGTNTPTIDRRLQGLEDQMGWIQTSLQQMIQNQQTMGVVGTPVPGIHSNSGGPPMLQEQQQQVWMQNQPTPQTAGPPYTVQGYPGPSHGSMTSPSLYDNAPPAGPSHYGPRGSMQSDMQPPRFTSPPRRHRIPELPVVRHEPSPDIPLRSLASRLEVARLLADGHAVYIEEDENGQVNSNDRSLSPDAVSLGPETDGRPMKRARFESDASVKSGRSVPTSGLRHALPQQKGDLRSAFNDPVDMGMCTDEEGRKLVDLFFSACHQFIPVYDPLTDTWESLRHRSPFSVSALMHIGKHVEDAGGPPSSLQVKCKEHAELIGKSTLFSPVAKIEAVQALMVLSCWGDTVWRPGHLAFSIAVDMGLYRCLPYLAQTGMGAGKDVQSLEEERGLVVGARVWIALFKLRYEMAYNHGRPVLMTDDDTLMYARKFLEHPLSNPSDSRLVASCELLALRLPLHQPISYQPSASVANLDIKLDEADRDVEDWFRYWDGFYDSHGLPIGHFLRESLISQMCHAILYANMRVLHTIRDRKTAMLLPDHRRRRVEDAVKAAQRLIDMTLRGKQYKATFIYANHYQHVGVAFTARTLIRLASLFPDIVDLRQASRDLEQLVSLLSQVSGFQTGQMLEEVLRRARRQQVLPPLSKPPSPKFGHQRLSSSGVPNNPYGLGQYGSDRSSAMRTGSLPQYPGHSDYSQGPLTGLSPDVGSVDSQPMFDFSLAEQLLTATVGGIQGGGVQPVEQNLIDPLFDQNIWFNFFPPTDFSGVNFGGDDGGQGPSGSTSQQNYNRGEGSDPFAFNAGGDGPSNSW